MGVDHPENFARAENPTGNVTGVPTADWNTIDSQVEKLGQHSATAASSLEKIAPNANSASSALANLAGAIRSAISAIGNTAANPGAIPAF